MISKIFKSTIYTLLAISSLHGYAISQGIPPEREKELEAKMQQMEARLKNMQVKLDSLKAKDSMNSFSNYNYASKSLKKAMKAMPKMSFKAMPPMPALPPMPPVDLAQTFSQTFSDSFSGLNKSINGNFSYSYNSSDKKLTEKIKNGDVTEKIKNYSKSYSVGSGDKLEIDNSFGSVKVNTWNKNEFKVDVEIKGIANDNDEAQRLLDGVSVSDSKDGSVISFKTNYESKSRHFWESSNNGNRTSAHKQEVNYTIYMPAKNSLSLKNSYGAIIIGDFDGKLNINSAYGKIIAKALTYADIDAQYSSVTVESLKGSDLNIAYGSLNLGSCDNITATIDYSPAKIAAIKNSGTFNLHYGGGLRIGELDKNFKNLNINTEYSSVIVGLDSDPNFNFDVSVSFASFNYGDRPINFTEKTSDDARRYNTTKSYKGHLGKGNSDRKITIRSDYGSVKFD